MAQRSRLTVEAVLTVHLFARLRHGVAASVVLGLVRLLQLVARDQSALLPSAVQVREGLPLCRSSDLWSKANLLLRLWHLNNFVN